jgi:hypothetical protein
MQSYIDQKRSIADRLRLIGSPVSEAGLQLYILHGLGIEYDSLIVFLNFKSDALPFNELASLLLTHEQRIQKHALASASMPSSVSIPASLTSSQAIPQANLAASTLNSELSAPFDELLLHQFQAFLASKGGSWRSKPLHKGSFNNAETVDKPTC